GCGGAGGGRGATPPPSGGAARSTLRAAGPFRRVGGANNQRQSSRQPSPGAGKRVPGPRVKRARNRRKPDWLRAILIVLLMGLAGECVWAAFNSPRLAVRRIVVAGSRTLSRDQVTAMMGVRLGTNIFRANLFRAR